MSSHVSEDEKLLFSTLFSYISSECFDQSHRIPLLSGSPFSDIVVSRYAMRKYGMIFLVVFVRTTQIGYYRHLLLVSSIELTEICTDFMM
jgi:hypothetical protein